MLKKHDVFYTFEIPEVTWYEPLYNIMLKDPIFIWQETTKKLFEGNSCLCRKRRLNCHIVLDDCESGLYLNRLLVQLSGEVICRQPKGLMSCCWHKLVAVPVFESAANPGFRQRWLQAGTWNRPGLHQASSRPEKAAWTASADELLVGHHQYRPRVVVDLPWKGQ